MGAIALHQPAKYLSIVPNVDAEVTNFFLPFKGNRTSERNTMLTTAKGAIHLSAVALGIIVVNFSTLPSNAQSRTADSFNFDDLSAGGKGSWNFKSEDEAVSIRDDLKELREYDISGVEYFDVRAIQRRNWRNRRGANQGDRYYYIENRIFPYYPVRDRIYY